MIELVAFSFTVKGTVLRNNVFFLNNFWWSAVWSSGSAKSRENGFTLRALLFEKF
jgi:hypothetical protein